jgi:hypothetical protein
MELLVWKYTIWQPCLFVEMMGDVRFPGFYGIALWTVLFLQRRKVWRQLLSEVVTSDWRDNRSAFPEIGVQLGSLGNGQRIRSSVARWYIHTCIAQIPLRVCLEGLEMENVGILYDHLEYFMTIWNILWPFGIFYDNLEYFMTIWNILWPFGIHIF